MEPSEKGSGFPFPLAVHIVIKIDEYIGMIYDTVHHSRHDKSGGHVEDGMLFDKHGRQDDRHTQNQGAGADTLILFQPCALHYRKMASQRVIHMDAGPEVRRGVSLVKYGNHSCEYIISRHDNGTKIVSVWPERADNQENCHSGKQECTDSEVVVPVLKEKVENDHRHIGKPQQIRDDKYLAEGDKVIRFQVDQMIVACHGFFQICEPLHIYDPIEDEWQSMSVFVTGFYKCLCHKICSLAWLVLDFLLTCFIIADQREKSK